MNDLFLKNEIISNKINYNIQEGITTATGDIPEGLPVHYFLERNIKKIENSNDKFLQNASIMLNLAGLKLTKNSHPGCKIPDGPKPLKRHTPVPLQMFRF